jgi:hypothetical protein
VQISDLAHFLWAAAFEADASIDEDEESAACRSLERGLLWAHRTFDELILPTTTVSLLDAVVYSCLSLSLCSSGIYGRCTRCPEQTLVESGRRRAHAVDKL